MDKELKTLILFGAVIAVTFAAMEMCADCQPEEVNASGGSTDGNDKGVLGTISDWLNRPRKWFHGK